MTGNIVGEPIVEVIDKQIDYRQQIHGAGYIPGTQKLQRTPEVQNYLNNRNSWIKMASGVSLSGSAAVEKIKDLSSNESNYLSTQDEAAMQGEGLAKGVVLFNSTQKFDSTKNSYIKRRGTINSYDFLSNSNKMYGGLGSSQRGLQPVPGIIDMSVECLNRGSIRKATVTLKAYNKFQFGLIELLYLRLGYSVMLEWGWDKYIDEITPGKDAITPPTVKIKQMESTIIENQWFDGKDYSQTDMINLVLANEERFKGNYGGFFGKVSNFSWTLNTDNTYDITLNLITVGSVIESLNINIPAISLDKNNLLKIKQELNEKLELGIDEDKVEESDNIILANVGSDKLSQWVNTTILGFDDLKKLTLTSTKDYIFAPTDLPRSTIRAKNTIPKESPYFVRFETFLSFLSSFLICNVVNGGKEDKELGFELDSELSRCNYETNLVPLNPNKVIFSVLMGDDVNKRLKRFNNFSFQGVVTTPFQYFNKNIAEFATKKDGVVYGKLLNCYLNLIFIQQAFVDAQNNKEEVGLFEFLQKICDGINESTGNCTNLEVVLKKDKTVVIIDQNQIKGGDKLIKNYEDKTEINIYGYEPQGSSTFVKDFKFQTKITPDLMNMVTIGATASDEKDINAIPFQTWNKGLVNRFSQGQKYDEDNTQTKEEKLNKDFKEAFADAIKNDKASYSSGNGYNFKYGNIEITNVWAEGITWTSDRDKDVKNEALLSAGLNKYKEELNKYNEIREIGNPNSIVIKNKAEANQNYMVYLSRAFGGPSGKLEILTGQDVGVYKGTRLREIITYPGNEMYFKWDNDDFIQQGKNSFKKYLSNINKAEAIALEPVISGTGFIPLELSITMDGLSGIKIYNRLKINTKFLPSSYPKSLKFIVKGVNHKVSGNVWDTNISTISVPVSINPPIQSTNTTSTTNTNQTNSTTNVTPTYRTNLVLNPPTNEARKIAEAYLGSNMTDEEWNNLVAATAAEASNNEEERAYVMAVMINRLRNKLRSNQNASIFDVLTRKNQFQAVTGTNANGRQPSPNFTNATQTTANAIFKGVEKYLAGVPKNFKYFTAAADAAYGDGTNIAFRDNMLAKGGKTIGGKYGTVFGTII